MNFLDQTQDIIINEELVQVPIDKLLLTCQSHPRLNKICQGRELWIARIKREFPEVDITQIQDPRAFYLRQSTFGGEIYIHANDSSLLFPSGVIPYNDLFVRTLEIARQPDYLPYNYVIVYSSPARNIDTPALNIIAVQDKEGVEIFPGPAQKITLVDIFILTKTQFGPSNLDNIRDIRKSINALIATGQPQVVIQQQIEDYERSITLEISRLTLSLSRAIIELHKKNNTAFYRRELHYIRKLIASNPSVVEFSDIKFNGNIQERKQALLDSILINVPSWRFHYTGRSEKFLGFSLYHEFTEFQREYISNLSDEQLKSLEFIVKGLIPNKLRIGMDVGSRYLATGLAFNSDGNIVLISF